MTFTVAGHPQTKGSAKAFRHRTSGKIIVRNDNARCKAWSDAVAWKARMAVGISPWPRQTDALVSVAMAFALERPKRTKLVAPALDLDKLVRAVLDAMTGIVYADDRQVVEVLATKGWGAPGVTVTVRLMESP